MARTITSLSSCAKLCGTHENFAAVYAKDVGGKLPLPTSDAWAQIRVYFNGDTCTGRLARNEIDPLKPTYTIENVTYPNPMNNPRIMLFPPKAGTWAGISNEGLDGSCVQGKFRYRDPTLWGATSKDLMSTPGVTMRTRYVFWDDLPSENDLFVDNQRKYRKFESWWKNEHNCERSYDSELFDVDYFVIDECNNFFDGANTTKFILSQKWILSNDNAEVAQTAYSQQDCRGEIVEQDSQILGCTTKEEPLCRENSNSFYPNYDLWSVFTSTYADVIDEPGEIASHG